MHLIAVGRLRGGPELALFQRYVSRLRHRLTVVEVHEARGTPTEIKRREGLALLAAAPRDAVLVALDLGGIVLDSATFNQRLRTWGALRAF